MIVWILKNLYPTNIITICSSGVTCVNNETSLGTLITSDYSSIILVKMIIYDYHSTTAANKLSASIFCSRSIKHKI